MKDLFVAICGSYMATLILTRGSIFNSQRQWLIDRTPWLQKLPMHGEPKPFHYFVCRLCFGALVAVPFAWYYDVNWFIVYAVPYIIATQER
jgi:hypothetical protein